MDPLRVSNLTSFSVERNSKISIARKEAGPHPDKRLETTYYIFLILEIKETLPTRKLLGGQKGSDVKSTHRPLCWNLFWLRDVCTHMGES